MMSECWIPSQNSAEELAEDLTPCHVTYCFDLFSRQCGNFYPAPPHRHQQQPQEGPRPARRQGNGTVVSEVKRCPAPRLLPRTRCMVSPWHGIISEVADSFPGLAKCVNSVNNVGSVV